MVSHQLTAQMSSMRDSYNLPRERETAAMDPQRRLLIEVAWEALEDGRPTFYHWYANLGIVRCAPTTVLTLGYDRDLDAYIPTGNSANFAAGQPGLHPRGTRTRGGHRHGLLIVVGGGAPGMPGRPARAGESDMALVGGTNLC